MGSDVGRTDGCWVGASCGRRRCATLPFGATGVAAARGHAAGGRGTLAPYRWPVVCACGNAVPIMFFICVCTLLTLISNGTEDSGFETTMLYFPSNQNIPSCACVRACSFMRVALHNG